MKRRAKTILIVVGIVIGIIILDTTQALIFNNNPLISIETKCRRNQGILVDTYHCGNEKNITKFKKSNACYYEDVCEEKLNIDYTIRLADINDLIISYLERPDAKKENIAYNYVDETNNKVIVGLLDASTQKQEKFIFDVFTSCCGSDYIRFIKENKLIEFKESKNVFDAEIIAVNDKTITAEVLNDSKSFKRLDKVLVRMTEDTDINNNSFTVGTNIRVTFNGNIEESNPPQIGATKIEYINNKE